MDPLTLGVVIAVGCSSAAAALFGARRRKRTRGAPSGDSGDARNAKAGGSATSSRISLAGDATAWARIGEVWGHLGDEYWLAGSLTLKREGASIARLFIAPERGKDRWAGVPRDGTTFWALSPASEMESMGWPGMEIPFQGGVLRRVEHGTAAIESAGEIDAGWEGLGRYAIFKSLTNVAVFVEGPQGRILALVGRTVPRALLEKIGA